MASLNLSINGPSIKSSYAGVVNSPAPSSGSATFAQWALFSVQAPLMNAFQDSGSKESILKVETTGDGELADLIEDFSEGRMQFAFVKVKDPNTSLPKNVLMAWCGGGVPERTKGYFTSHLNAVAKVLHGYHVQITARSDADLEPATIIQKVADASGAKYSSGAASGGAAAPPPPVKTKPVFTPTTMSAGRSVNPIVAARSQKQQNVDADGWGDDAPPVTRSTIEKVESSYKPTRVDMGNLISGRNESTTGSVSRGDDSGDVVKGAYQPVGKVDIAAIRAAAKNQNDDRPTPVKGAYEPVGKVDIAAIRSKARPSEPSTPPVQQDDSGQGSRSLADRASTFSQSSQSERLTTLPKPKVGNKFGGASNFSGTKAPLPGGLGFGEPAPSASAPVGAASRTFADQGGKTPAQIWAEKKAKQGGTALTPNAQTTAPVIAQTSGSEWKSGYSGKSWAPVHTSGQFGRPDAGQLSAENTGEIAREHQEEPGQEAGGISALRDRFTESPPIGGSARGALTSGSRELDGDSAAPPPLPAASRPGAPSGGFALPGLPSRPTPADEEEEEEEDPSAYVPEGAESPPRIAVPVSRQTTLQKPDDIPAPPPVPPAQIDVPDEDDLAEEHIHDPGRAAATAVAAETFEQEHVVAAGSASQGGKVALIQYDYEKAEDNEIELVEGEYVTNIDMVDEDWWMGTNSKGESGLFPSNYVELVEDDGHDAPNPHVHAAAAAAAAAAAEPEPEPEPTHAPAHAAEAGGATATALYDYEAAEDNELSFPEDAKITNLQFPDEDWWFGSYGGHQGLFPANYVQLNQ